MTTLTPEDKKAHARSLAYIRRRMLALEGALAAAPKPAAKTSAAHPRRSAPLAAKRAKR
jgi:hypothetical protein